MTARRAREFLTSDQEALTRLWADQWIARGRSVEPADRERVEDGMRRCYERNRRRWHGRVVWVGSPVVGLLAAIAARMRHCGLAGDADRPCGRACAAREPVQPWHKALTLGWEAGQRGRWTSPLRALWGWHGPAFSQRPAGSIRSAVRQAVHEPVAGAVDSLLPWAGTPRPADLRVPAEQIADGALRDLVSRAVHQARPDLRCGTRRADLIIDDLARHGSRILRRSAFVDPMWVGHAWLAEAAFLHEVCGLRPAGDRWDTLCAWADACSAGWWWAFEEFALVSERPREIHAEQVGPPGRGSHRMHRADGPAISWRDGQALHYWHGTPVPQWVVGDDCGPRRIDVELNMEARRCAIERYGWDQYLAEKRLVPLESDGWGELYDDPTAPGRRVVVVTNGTPERDGTLRRYGLTVPAELTSPLEAVAWTYGLTPRQYELIQRRT
jgi:hypothetical protein